jgi:hypothetical protein
LRPNPKASLTYLSLLILVALALGAARAPHHETRPVSTPHSSSAVVPDLAGSWTGGWEDTVFNVVSPATFILGMSSDSLTGSGTMDLTGVGLGSAEPFTIAGSISGNTITFHLEFTMASTLTSTADGTLTDTVLGGMGHVGTPLNFGDYTFSGTAVSSAIFSQFSYGPGQGAGYFAAAKTTAVEPESWARTKARYLPRR